MTLILLRVEFELIRSSVENTFEVILGLLHDALGAVVLKVFSCDWFVTTAQESVDLLLPAADKGAVE